MKAMLWSLLSLLLITSVYAQNTRTITGTVKDDKGNTLPGVTIEVKGARTYAATNASGVFSVTVPSGAKTLIISSVGMKQKEVSIGSSNIVEITLEPTVQNLNEVVVIGYGTAKRANITSSISSVSAKDIKDLPVAGVDP